MMIKNMCAVLALAAILMLPFSASAMSLLTDSELSVVRGTSLGLPNANFNAEGPATSAALIRNPVDSSRLDASNKAGTSIFTGKSGVAIYFDVTLTLHFDVLAWGDRDGIRPR